METPVTEGEVLEYSVATVQAPQQHLVVGLAALASLSEEEFNAKLDLLNRGQERLETIVKRLLTYGEDYGKVPGITKPFLHLPGAEKLEKFYGYAVRQEADRVIGDGITSPPFGYHVRSYIHLGDLNGPVIDQGYGEANVWEDKYRYHFAKATCPSCGREGLVRGKKDGPLQGRYWCPGREGGCNKKFEPGTIPQAGKVENDNPWSQAETILLMASKRSFVHGIRRATGTSGYFTQDEDAPSVIAQSDDVPPERPEPTVEQGPPGIAVSVGAKSTEATQLQRKMLADKAKEKGLNGAKIADLLARLFNMEVEPTGAAASAAVKTLNGEQIGKLLHTIETGEVAETDAERRTRIENEPVASFPPQSSDEM